MGLDLTLLPFDVDSDVLSFSHTVLSCERGGDLFYVIKKLPTQIVPSIFQSYLSRDNEEQLQYFKLPTDIKSRLMGNLGTHYGTTVITPYGDSLTFTTVEALLNFIEHPDVMSSVKNKAIWAYLSMLKAETKIALFWN